MAKSLSGFIAAINQTEIDMEDFDYFGSNLPAQNGDAEGTPDYEDFSETVEEAAAIAKRCKAERKAFFDKILNR